MLRRSSLLSILVIALAPVAQGADLASAQVEPLQRDLARPYVHKKWSGDWHIGLGLAQHKSYQMDPRLDHSNAGETSFKFELRLPWQLETGISLRSLTENSSSSGLGSAFHVRAHLLETPRFRLSLGLQHELAGNKKSTFHRLSASRSSLFASQEFSFFPWLHEGLYVMHSQRQAEAFNELKIGNELVYGGRLTVGPAMLHLMGDYQARQLEIENTATGKQRGENTQQVSSGVGSAYGAFELTAAALLASKNPGFGLPKTGYRVECAYRFGADGNEQAVVRKQREAKSQNIKSPVKTSAYKANPGTQPKAVVGQESAEADDFEMLDRALENERLDQDQESPAEAAERELKDLREASKKQQAEEKAKEENRRREYENAVKQQVKEESSMIDEHSDDIEEELNQFSLPDQDELNWNGLKK